MRSSAATDDESIRSEWAGGRCPPIVFIVGLHRSGTTFLYESLSQIFPVAKLTVRDVVFYRTLIASYQHDEGHADSQLLASYFQNHAIKTRGHDPLSLSPRTAEEYGWILKKECGSYLANAATLPVLRDIVLKLKFLNPGAQAILLKNPWDTGSVNEIAKEFPSARFVFIRRDPMEILNSELGNMLYFTANRDPLVALLTDGIIGTRIGLTIARTIRTIIGTSLFSRLYIALILKDIASNIRAFDLSLSTAASEGRAIEVTYSALVDGPVEILKKIASFVELPVDCAALAAISPARRSGGLSPLITAREKVLRARLSHGEA